MSSITPVNTITRHQLQTLIGDAMEDLDEQELQRVLNSLLYSCNSRINGNGRNWSGLRQAVSNAWSGVQRQVQQTTRTMHDPVAYEAAAEQLQAKQDTAEAMETSLGLIEAFYDAIKTGYEQFYAETWTPNASVNTTDASKLVISSEMLEAVEALRQRGLAPDLPDNVTDALKS